MVHVILFCYRVKMFWTESFVQSKKLCRVLFFRGSVRPQGDCDMHYSDWLEIWSQLTVPAGQRKGYDKGNK